MDLKIIKEDMDSLSDVETLNSKCFEDDDSNDEATLWVEAGKMEAG